MKFYNGFKLRWKSSWAEGSFRAQLFLVLLVLILIAFLIPVFFEYVQNRAGIQLKDWVLSNINPVDLSYPIFILIYGAIICAVLFLINEPTHFIKCLQAYVLLVSLRIVCMYIVPLEPPVGMITLTDPFVGKLFYKGALITKDLFFSGHSSILFLLTLLISWKPLKYTMAIATLLVAFFLMMQHVHYTIDILAAPVFAWLSFKIISENNPKPKTQNLRTS